MKQPRCTEQLNIRIDKSTKEDLEKLKYLKVDIPTLIRDAIRASVDTAFEVLELGAQVAS